MKSLIVGSIAMLLTTTAIAEIPNFTSKDVDNMNKNIIAEQRHRQHLVDETPSAPLQKCNAVGPVVAYRLAKDYNFFDMYTESFDETSGARYDIFKSKEKDKDGDTSVMVVENFFEIKDGVAKPVMACLISGGFTNEVNLKQVQDAWATQSAKILSRGEPSAPNTSPSTPSQDPQIPNNPQNDDHL